MRRARVQKKRRKKNEKESGYKRNGGYKKEKRGEEMRERRVGGSRMRGMRGGEKKTTIYFAFRDGENGCWRTVSHARQLL